MFLEKLLKDDKITQKQYNYLYPTSTLVPRLYCTPKIHKEGTPLRPIVDYTGSLSYNTSKALSELLSPIVGRTEHHLKNSKQLANRLKTETVGDNEVLVSHDVVALFPSIPMPQAMEIIHRRLVEYTSLKERTNLTPDDVIELLNFTLTTTYFTFRGKLYEQVFGAAMGSPVSVVISNLYMEDWEQRALATCPPDIKPSLWLRYVDEIMEKVPENSTERLTEHLNTVDPTGSIQVTCEEEQNKALPMLDAKATRQPDGSLDVSVYRKKTHTGQYLAFQSNHPLHHKLGVIRTLLDRSDTLNTSEEEKVKEEKHVAGALKNCGYPPWAIRKVKKMRATPKDNSKKNDEKSSTPSRGQVNLPYVAGLSESFARLLKRHRVQSAMKPYNTLRQNLVHPKDKRPITDNAGVIYKIPCQQCPKSYIGETGRCFGIRLKEHKDEAEKVERSARFTRLQRKTSESTYHKSALTDHSSQNNHVIDWENSKLVGREDQWRNNPHSAKRRYCYQPRRRKLRPTAPLDPPVID